MWQFNSKCTVKIKRVPRKPWQVKCIKSFVSSLEFHANEFFKQPVPGISQLKSFNATKLIWNHKDVLQNSKARPHQPSSKTWDSEIYKRTARLKAIFEIINEIYQTVQTRIIQ